MAGIFRVLGEVENLLKAVNPNLVFGRGAAAIDQHGSPPRIVWVWTNSNHGPPEKVDAREKSILTRSPTIFAHVWGVDDDDTEALVDDVINALYQVAHGSIAFGGEEVPPTDSTNRGLAVVVQFSLDMPVLRRRFKKPDREQDTKVTTASPTGIVADTTISSPGDGNVDWQEP